MTLLPLSKWASATDVCGARSRVARLPLLQPCLPALLDVTDAALFPHCQCLLLQLSRFARVKGAAFPLDQKHIWRGVDEGHRFPKTGGCQGLKARSTARFCTTPFETCSSQVHFSSSFFLSVSVLFLWAGRRRASRRIGPSIFAPFHSVQCCVGSKKDKGGKTIVKYPRLFW